MKILEFGYMHVNKIDIYFFVFFEIMEIFEFLNFFLKFQWKPIIFNIECVFYSVSL